MEILEKVPCPFCGQFNEIPLEASLAHQRLGTDCEVCCRPFEIEVECENGEILNLETRAN